MALLTDDKAERLLPSECMIMYATFSCFLSFFFVLERFPPLFCRTFFSNIFVRNVVISFSKEVMLSNGLFLSVCFGFLYMSEYECDFFRIC